MSLQIEWQYLQRNVPGVGFLMGPIEDSLREAFFPAIFGLKEVSDDLRKIQRHIMKKSGQFIPEPCLLMDCAYNNYKVASEVLVGSLIGGTDLNYVAHKRCVRRASVNGRKQR